MKKTMRFMQICLFIFLLSKEVELVHGQENTGYPPGNWERIIENVVFDDTLRLDEGDDNTLIIGAVFENFEGDAIKLRNVSNVYIKNCTIRNIDGDGIVLRSTGSTDNITIDGCKIENTTGDGIIAKQRAEDGVYHSNLVVKNNYVSTNGEDRFDHNIYIQASDSIIENNMVHNSFGHGISIRSSGVVSGNTIWGSDKSCIRYYSDHEKGFSDLLVIENNVCYLDALGEGAPGISLLVDDDSSINWVLNNFVVRFNTVVIAGVDRYGIAVESFALEQKNVAVYGNLVVNTLDLSNAISSNYMDYYSGNFTTDSIAVFVDISGPPYDFSLSEISPARGYATGVIDYPEKDISGNIRGGETLDAGAYHFYQPVILEATEEIILQGQSPEQATQTPANIDAEKNLNNKGNSPKYVNWEWKLITLFSVLIVLVLLRIFRIIPKRR